MLLLVRGTALVAEGALGAGGGSVFAQEVFEKSESFLVAPSIRKARTL